MRMPPRRPTLDAPSRSAERVAQSNGEDSPGQATDGTAGSGEAPRGLKLDAAARHLIRALGHNGRATNRSLAAEIGLTEATVAARIRNLMDQQVVAVTAVFDWKTAGYEWDLWLSLRVDGRSVYDVGQDIGALPGVRAVLAVLGPVDLVVHMLAADRRQVVEMLDRIRSISGVLSVSSDVTLETLKYTVNLGRLPIRPREIEFPAPQVTIEPIDRALITALVADGRQSNRDIAKQMGVSEGTVRTHLKRLAPLLRICAQFDPFRAGDVGANVCCGVELRGGSATEFLARVREMREVTVVARTTGRHDLLLMMGARSRSQLVEAVVEKVRSFPQVRATETLDIVRTIRWDYQWARLL